MKFWLKYAFRELIYTKAFSFFYILTLVLSTSGLTLIVFFGGEIQSQIANKAKNALAADLSISARRAIESDEIKKLENEFSQEIEGRSHSFEFFSMLNLGDTPRLVLAKVIDANYPFYGDLENEDKVARRGTDIQPGKIWLSKDAVRSLGAKKGDILKLGSAEFEFSEEIHKDPTQTFRLGLLAPKVYIHIDNLKDTKLIQAGSTFTEIFLYKLKHEEIARGEVSISERLQKKFSDPSLRFANYKEASENSNRQLTLFADFLSLAALISFLVGLLGVYYINLNFIKQKSKNISLLKFLGASHQDVKRFIFYELGTLLLVSVLLSSFILYFALPFGFLYLEKFFSIAADSVQLSKLFLIAFLLNLFAVILSLFPFLQSLKEVSPKSLLNESSESLVNVRTKLFLTVVLIAITLMSLVQSRSVQFSLVFISSLIFAYLCSFLPFLFFRVIESCGGMKNWQLNYVVNNIKASRFAYQTLFAAMITAVMFSTALPLIQVSIEKELHPTNRKIPNLFLFDIQEEQKPELEDILNKVSESKPQFSNLIRARIIKVNEENFERQNIGSLATREEEADSRMRNRGVNISVRDHLSESESLIDGKLWSDPQRTEVSIEDRYMERLKLKMGDKLLFDIQGVEIEAFITSVRKVNWNSFSPNFFILFEPGFIDEAPKTYLTALNTVVDKVQVQSNLFQKFPNISVIDFESTLTEVLSMIDEISLAFYFLAGMALVMGAFLLVLIVLSLMIERLQQWALLRAMGGLKRQLYLIFGGELVALVIISLFIGFALSSLLTWLLALKFFETQYLIAWSFYFKYLTGASALIFIFLFLFFRYLNSKKVLEILKS